MKKITAHFAKLGFTNRLALILVLLVVAGMGGGFYLAILSIKSSYTGALACWTICFTPLGYGIQQVLGKIVDKNKAENTKDGIVFETAVNTDRDC